MAEKSVNEIVKSIQNGQIAPIYYLYGKEKYFHDLIIRTLEKAIFPDPSTKSLNLSVVYGAEGTLSDVISACLGYPMLSDKKLVIVRDLNKLAISDQESFKKYLNHPVESTCLVLSAEESNKAIPPNTIKKNAVAVACNPIKEYNIHKFLKEKCKQNEIAIEDQAIHFLINHIGSNLLNLDLELEKVRNYKGDRSVITVDDLSVTTGISKEINIFALQKALAARHLSLSLQICKELTESGEYPPLINAVLFGFFRKALITSNLKKFGRSRSQISSETGLSEYQLKDVLETTLHFSETQLESVISIIHETDRTLKSSSIKPEVALQMLCYKICRI